MTEPTKTILLAEEDPLSRSFLSEQLSFDGYEVIEADSRAKALAILGTRQPDLLIADVNGETLSLIDAVREADGLASRIDPGTPMLVLAPGPRSSPACATSSADRTTCWPSPTATPSSGRA